MEENMPLAYRKLREENPYSKNKLKYPGLWHVLYCTVEQKKIPKHEKKINQILNGAKQ